MAKIPANILRMALDAIDEPVAAIGKAVSDMPETAARALDDMAGAVDDWGWKGGKPKGLSVNEELSKVTGNTVYSIKPKRFLEEFSPGYPYTRDKAVSWDDVQDDDWFWEGPDISLSDGLPDSNDFEKLISSIEKTGILKPVVVSRDGTVLDGHHRVIAASIADKPIYFTIGKY